MDLLDCAICVMSDVMYVTGISPGLLYKGNHMLLNKQNVHLTQPTPALTPVYLTSRRGVDTEDGSLASDHDYHIVICSVTRGLVQRPGRPWTPCVMLPTNPAPYTIVEWGIQTARYNWHGFIARRTSAKLSELLKKHS